MQLRTQQVMLYLLSYLPQESVQDSLILLLSQDLGTPVITGKHIIKALKKIGLRWFEAKVATTSFNTRTAGVPWCPYKQARQSAVGFWLKSCVTVR